MSEREQSFEQPLLSEKTLGIIIATGLMIAIFGLMLSGMSTIDDTDIVTSFLLVGLTIAILGVIFWLIWHRPWETFDDLQTPFYRGEHEPEPDPEAGPGLSTEPVAVAPPRPAATPPRPPASASGIEPDNLTLIEGIGPKTAEALAAAGITTFAQLAARTPDELETLVKDQGVRLVGSAESWPEQARLAAGGEATALDDLQDRVEAGGARSDDLTIIEGVGPKTADALRAEGVRTFLAMADRTPEDLEALVRNQGVRLVASTETWPEQARLAALGDLSALGALQARISGGVLQGDVPAAPETAAVEPDAAADPATPDNLRLIEGVGPKIEQILHENGFPTYQAIAGADPDAIRAVLEAAGSRYRLADPTTWPKQAAFLLAGDLDGLQAFQENLKGGRLTDES